MVEALLQFVIPIGLIVLGFVTGKCIEKRHLEKLAKREEDLKELKVCNLQRLPEELQIKESFIVTGSCVIATDYFKVFVATLRNLFGGEIKTYRSLMSRARREALVRLLEQAKKLGGESVWNVRFETSTIQGKSKRRKPGGVEVLAYGTAVKSA